MCKTLTWSLDLCLDPEFINISDGHVGMSILKGGIPHLPNFGLVSEKE